MGPVAVSAALVLLLVSPLMRGGNREIALIALEALALGFLLSLWLGFLTGRRGHGSVKFSFMRLMEIGFLVLSPLWLAIAYLVPLPVELWSNLSGRDLYRELADAARLEARTQLPLSLAPDATRSSLLAGLTLMAGFLAGYLCQLKQLKLLLSAVVFIAFVQIVFGLLQMAGGPDSALNLGIGGGRPFGTFANPNHFANYIAMAASAYVLLSWGGLSRASLNGVDSERASFNGRHSQALWVAGGIFLVLGLLTSLSRGAVLTGLPAALVAATVAALLNGRPHSLRFTMAVVITVVVGAVLLIGIGVLLARFDFDSLTSSAQLRDLLAATTIDAARQFWPWGAGWGTYAAVYPRFQVAAVAGFADHAHHDYAQMLFEGGAFAAMLALVFLWLAATRAVVLTTNAIRHRFLRPQEMAAAVCGIGLAGFLMHSLVEFNMHIPANAIVACLLAGTFLRPLASSATR